MSPGDPNLDRVELAVELLGPLMDELCLVGGSVTGLLLTDPGSAPIRPTVDVYVALDAMQYVKYGNFEPAIAAAHAKIVLDRMGQLCQ